MHTQTEHLPAAMPPQPAPTVLINLAEVIRRTGLSSSEIYRRIDRGDFPQQVQLTPRRVAWVESEIEAYNRALVAKRGSHA